MRRAGGEPPRRAGAGGGGSSASVGFLIWVAFAAAVLLYGGVGMVLRGEIAPSEASLPSWLFPLVGAALFAFALVGGKLLGGAGGPSQRRSAGGGGAARGRAGGAFSLDIVRWALDESVAIVGLVALLLGSSLTAFVPYLLGSLLLLWFHRPKES